MHGKPSIVIADDDLPTLDLLRQMLENLGYEARMTTNGLEALSAIREEPPDLLLSDVMMPQMDGLELCRRIKEDRATRLIPVVLLTGLGSVEDRVKGIEAGADDFISKPFQISELSARLRSLLKLKQFTDELEHAEEVIFSLALTVEAKDPYTEGHCQRLSLFSVEVGRRLGLGEEDLQALRRGGILHDIGKIGISDTILFKPGPLNREETAEMRSHTSKGEEICRPLRSLATALPIIRHHHERMDGTGYPDGLEGEQIPINARIVAAVDYVDALVTDRPYRKALPMDEALTMLHKAVETGHLDGRVVKEVAGIVAEVGEGWATTTKEVSLL
jgi:putative two-component system response regulator